MLVTFMEHLWQHLLMLMYKKKRNDFSMHRVFLVILEKASELFLRLIVMKMACINVAHILWGLSYGMFFDWML